MTNLNFLSNRSGFAPDLTTRQSRSDSLSIVSRQSVLVLLLLCMAFFVGVGKAWGAETLLYTLDGTTTTPGSAYATASDVTQNSKSWKVTANTEQNPWRIGGKSITKQDRNIYCTSTFTEDITKVTVSTGATASSCTVNSITLIVSTSQNGGGTVTDTEKKTSGLTSATLTFSRPDGHDWSGKYFTIVFNVTRSGSSGNGYVAFNNAKLYYDPDAGGGCETLSAPGSPSSTAYATSVDLSWNSVANSSGYLVTFDGTEYNIASGTTTKTITGLKKEKTYAWTVAAKGDGSIYCALGTATSEQSVTTLDGCTDNKVTYTVASTSSVTPSGAPGGTSASYSSTYGTVYQLTGGNSMTLTLSGYAGKTIKGLTLDMRSNGSTGAGTFSMVIGSTTVASISSATTFDEWYDNDAYGTDYRKVHVTLSDEVTVGAAEDIVITIAATTNSLYCQGFAMCYEAVSCGSAPTVSNGSLKGSFLWTNLFEPLIPCI